MGQMGQMGIWEGHMSLQARSNVSNGSNSPPDTCGGPLVPALRKISEKIFSQNRGQMGQMGVPDAHMSHMPECKWVKWVPKEGHMALLKRDIWVS